ncbi:avidin-like [Pithys albifrons albifrons]|uniref:avidin-like n=1 Tax=Pithys albifrons albifrons TaxID=3385563 RepID=UPI003A5CC1D5
MEQTTLFLLVLCLALGAHILSAEKCNLTGRWKNDLGSNMTISAVNEKGNFTGLYTTSVEDTPHKVPPSPLLGFQNITKEIHQPTFGFTVKWIDINSISVFTGQCFVDKNGTEVLKTMWLLRSDAGNIKNDWKATRVGTNEFTRLEPQME